MSTAEQLEKLREKPLCYPKEAASIGQCTSRMVTKLLNQGTIRGVRVGRNWRVNTQSWLAYLGLN